MATVGCDPEFTILGPDGTPVPAHAVGIPARENTRSWRGITETRAFRDGFNVEINVGAHTCRANMLQDVRTALQKLVLGQLPDGYKLTARAAYRIDPEKVLADAPEDVKMFGCSPSLDAYTGREKIVNVDAATWPWRYAGGHLHFGTCTKYGAGERALSDPDNHRDLVRLFDRFIGLPLAVIFDDDMQWKRREFYGQAGEYRHQKYSDVEVGVEYRVPPPEVFNHPALVTLFLGIGRDLINSFDFLRASKPSLFDPKYDDDVVKAINTGVGANKLLGNAGYYYTPSTIRNLKEVPEIHVFNPSYAHDPHTGWSEFRHLWKIDKPVSNGSWTFPG